MINQWLQNFTTHWINKDIEAVISLFTDNVEYWENPHQKLEGKDDLRKEWQAIINQQNVFLTTNVFLSNENTHVVSWNLLYDTVSGETQKWAGVYLVRLDDDGLCSYFYQVGERNKD